MKNYGFTLVEVLIAAAIFGGLVLAGLQLSQNATKSSVKANFDTEIVLVSNEMVAILSDPVKCRATFIGKNALSTTSGITNIDGKYFTKNSGSSPNSGYGNAGLEIESYALNGTVAEIASNNSTLLISYFNKNLLKGNTGPTTKIRKIQLFVEVDSTNNIINCRSLSSSSADIWSRSSGASIFYNGGNVGIGTNTPTSKLEINGTLKLSGVAIGSSCHSLGEQAFEQSTGAPVYCNGSNWKAVGGTIEIINSSVCPSGKSMIVKYISGTPKTCSWAGGTMGGSSYAGTSCTTSSGWISPNSTPNCIYPVTSCTCSSSHCCTTTATTCVHPNQIPDKVLCD